MQKFPRTNKYCNFHFHDNLDTKAIFVIATLVAAVGTIGIMAGAPAADAQQNRAPGQVGNNPGQAEGASPPGQNVFGNPGQCQKFLQELDFTKEFAHENCHGQLP